MMTRDCKEECVDYSVNFWMEITRDPGMIGSGIAVAPERRCLDDIYDSNGTTLTLAYEACDVCTQTHIVLGLNQILEERCHERADGQGDGRLAQDACEEVMR